ncbi:hypothetical protein Hs30E_03320 [Lactococcus hodotermopsidis]|uniref:TVP38/TMEM64 family membrane protein n=1 Tax=Pseudolactococcus hodotermopsidis TaxID=2709157 RepID=A0A6A0BBD9_9LACT|nr:hypothetical protein Hs30E_03320 [Lactococcus hodotermopsidis]
MLAVNLYPILQQILKHPKDMADITSYIEKYGAKALPVLLALQVVAFFIPGFPPSSVSILSGLCYGAFLGAAVSIVGIFISNSLLFLFSREIQSFLFDEKSSSKASNKIGSLIDKAKSERQVIFVVYLVPIVPNLILPIVFSNRGMTYRTFILSVLTVAVPSTFLYCLLGERVSNGDFKTALILLIVILAILVTAWLIITKSRRKK